MIGEVNADLEPTIVIGIEQSDGTKREVRAIVDTGFNGYLTLPESVVGELRLAYHSQTLATLADGRQIALARYLGTVEWLAQARDIIVLEAEGAPLVGTSLLLSNRLQVDVVPRGRVIVGPLPQ